MSDLDISVVICVYTEDLWEDILAAVSSVRAQSRPAHETLLVVDHNQTLLERLSGEYKEVEEVRVLANAGPRGLSAGRNTGIAASHGEVIAFLDDDAVAERDWLRRFAEGYADPRVLAVGGRTVPIWASGRRPAWFPEEFDWVVGCTYRGLPPGRVLPLAVNDVAPGVPVDGPAPELEQEMRALHLRHYGREPSG